MSNLLTEKEAAAILRINQKTLGQMAKEGKVEFVLVGKRRRYQSDFIEQLKRGPVSNDITTEAEKTAG